MSQRMNERCYVSETDVTPAILSRVFDARLWRASKSHRIEQRSVPKTSRATVRRAMTQRATRPVTLATLTRDPLSRVKSRATLSQVWHRSYRRCTSFTISFTVMYCSEHNVLVALIWQCCIGLFVSMHACHIQFNKLSWLTTSRPWNFWRVKKSRRGEAASICVKPEWLKLINYLIC